MIRSGMFWSYSLRADPGLNIDIYNILKDIMIFNKSSRFQCCYGIRSIGSVGYCWQTTCVPHGQRSITDHLQLSIIIITNKKTIIYFCEFFHCIIIIIYLLRSLILKANREGKSVTFLCSLIKITNVTLIEIATIMYWNWIITLKWGWERGGGKKTCKPFRIPNFSKPTQNQKVLTIH